MTKYSSCTKGDLEPTGQRLFTFAVIADTHVNEHEQQSTSPFSTNAMANARARFAFSEIAALDPPAEFVVHLGDIVHPMPGVPGAVEAARRFKEIASTLSAPLYLVPGNHDVGDKAVDWMPADIVTSEYVEGYRNAFGNDYYAFSCGPIRAIVINAQLLNSGLPQEAEQRSWLEAEFAASAGKRVFLFTHYPPYVLASDERSTYDNIDQPGRSWLLDLLIKYKAEALFAGHVHNFWYDLHGQTEMYLLPATSFLRHDYSEFYRVNPGVEFGRDDRGKFGYCIVDVHERGHVMRLVRTDGRTLPPGISHQPRKAPPPPSVKAAPNTGVGVELRHPWAEILEIPATGGVQEFGRKSARNDYPLMALWEMGARLLKVPDHDLVNAATRERMKLMSRVGHQFITTSFGVPRTGFCDALDQSPQVLDSIEINLGSAQLKKQAARIASFRAKFDTRLYWAKLRMNEDAHYDGKHVSHFIKTGFTPSELGSVETTLDDAGARQLFEGVVVRIDRGVDVLKTAADLARFAERTHLSVLASVKLADASIARERSDDFDTARLTAETLICASISPSVRYVFDTFMDVDRGYFPRRGFIDRMFNSRPALHAYAGMSQALGGRTGTRVEFDGNEGDIRTVCYRSGGDTHILVSGASVDTAMTTASSVGARNVLNLLTGKYEARGAPQREPASGLWLLEFCSESHITLEDARSSSGGR